MGIGHSRRHAVPIFNRGMVAKTFYMIILCSWRLKLLLAQANCRYTNVVNLHVLTVKMAHSKFSFKTAQ